MIVPVADHWRDKDKEMGTVYEKKARELVGRRRGVRFMIWLHPDEYEMIWERAEALDVPRSQIVRDGALARCKETV